MEIRAAESRDVERMVLLSRKKRRRYATYSPVFWKPAEEAEEKQRGYFQYLLGQEDAQFLVAEESGKVVGFIIGQIRNPPPVYDPGGKACFIDDFEVESDESWGDVGENLKSELEKKCRSLGVNLTVTVCGEKDFPKRGFIRSRGEEIASEWYIKAVD